MKTPLVLPSVCDVTEPKKMMNNLQVYEQRMSNARTFRDDKGGLVTKTPYSWEELEEKVSQGDLEFGR